MAHASPNALTMLFHIHVAAPRLHRTLFAAVFMLAVGLLLPPFTGAKPLQDALHDSLVYDTQKASALSPLSTTSNASRLNTSIDVDALIASVSSKLDMFNQPQLASGSVTAWDRQGHDGALPQTQKIGADYRFNLFGTSLQTGLEMMRESGVDNRITTGKVSAQVPLGSAMVNAQVQVVDIDRLRNLTLEDAIHKTGDQTKLGLGGSWALGNSGSFRIGYELKQTQGHTGAKLATSADAGVEYSVNERARLTAGYNVDADLLGTRASTNFDLGYDINRDTNLRARYELINFSDAAKKDYRANVAQAQLTVRF